MLWLARWDLAIGMSKKPADDARCNLAGDISTSDNFFIKSETHTRIKFLRLTYKKEPIRTNDCDLINSPFDDCAPDTDRTSAASLCHYRSGAHRTGYISYRTFIPSPVKVEMCSGVPQYEEFSRTLKRIRNWVTLINRNVISVESVTYPLRNIWHKQDGGESTVQQGEWSTSGRGRKRWRIGRRRCLVYLVRLYLDGPFQEPSSSLLPATPLVEEIKDCTCNIL
ncbi:hypothetical protein HELRODRAFT_178545 [Helobdella robusta]|uniref:Uncharacterized protein n=1 Tax=Helobdella robusta TaxID=6412 RepID=T1FDC5_HELRO|nr:hypothetical protein HELRODRAFT_178545 [Helobdella robusta]ESN97095.1 hypothetical protein HELRODRAFT_178545 [Helobdella robusta]